MRATGPRVASDPHECAHDLVELAASRESLGEFATDAFRNVEQRSQRPRREERIARAPEDLHAARVLIKKLV